MFTRRYLRGRVCFLENSAAADVFGLSNEAAAPRKCCGSAYANHFGVGLGAVSGVHFLRSKSAKSLPYIITKLMCCLYSKWAINKYDINPGIRCIITIIVSIWFNYPNNNMR